MEETRRRALITRIDRDNNILTKTCVVNHDYNKQGTKYIPAGDFKMCMEFIGYRSGEDRGVRIELINPDTNALEEYYATGSFLYKGQTQTV